MIKVSDEVFDGYMHEAVENIPNVFKNKIENLAFISEDYPTEDDIERLGLKNKYSLLGLYSGVPYTYRNTYYMNVTPDRIILYKKNIESHCDNIEELKEKIREVVIHEVAHYFGMDEDEVRSAGY